MPGKRITRHQESLYMSKRQRGQSQQTAAAQAAISERSGRRIEKGERVSIPGERHWRTREDPLESIWQKELVPLLEKESQLTGLTLWEYLEDEHAGQFPFSVLRTLQRRVKHWKATQGPEKVVIFRQSVPAGQQGLSDFSHPNTTITLQGKVFTHLLYQFRFAYSGWRYVQIVLGGESYSALADGLQSALMLAGGSPLEHRTDSLSAAFNNHRDEQTLTQSYEALCTHYRLRATRNNCGVSHENGAIECAHGSFKHRLDQALKLRGSSDFADIKAYQAFLDHVSERLNRRCQARFREEQLALQPLPGGRFMDYSELSLKVTRSSTVEIKRVLYTVPSRLIGEHVRVHVYHDRLVMFVGQALTATLPRIYPKAGQERARRIDYRHLIHSLSAKPQAFRFLQFRDDLLPTDIYRQLWLHSDRQLDAREACKWMVGVLRIAMDHDCEERLGHELLTTIEQHQPLPSLKALQERYLGQHPVPSIPARQHDLGSYDHLLQGSWHQPEVGYA
ncbi:IS21 family transposase [Methylomonas sp. MO1]|nr:IS21 family transposase [Methylomonas sp. MO1]MDT4289577.1 IS21 family transposase [Methylomonas sp. MO1]MDT4291216.1 IS21 family transposase [Methylomonas sp. MO1]MDT4291792.1 IS21 family transposase [Methylomonas sp. MO1]MDT4292012.1 IS21 family transposase [Methylomonas sp. MO1]